jgi:hypothetical protein
MARMKAHHSETSVWPFVHHCMHPLYGIHINVGQEQGLNGGIIAALHCGLPLSIERGLVQVGMGVYEVHSAKLVR